MNRLRFFLGLLGCVFPFENCEIGPLADFDFSSVGFHRVITHLCFIIIMIWVYQNYLKFWHAPVTIFHPIPITFPQSFLLNIEKVFIDFSQKNSIEILSNILGLCGFIDEIRNPFRFCCKKEQALLKQIIFIVNISVMKKPRFDKPILPITLSAKRPKTARNETTATPAKLELKNNTTLFSSMRKELSSMKNDVEKLIQKENQTPVLKTINTTNNHSKTESKLIREVEEKSKAMEQRSEVQEQLRKQLNIQKNIIQSLKQENVNICQHHAEKTKQINEIEQQRKQEMLCSRETQEKLMRKIQQLQQSKQTPNLEQLGAEFEKKINLMIQQNRQLKNKLNKSQADLSKLEHEKSVLMVTISEYEERDRAVPVEKLTKDERVQLYEQISTLKQEKEQLEEEYEYKLMKLENQYDQIRRVNSPRQSVSSSNDFNRILKEQLSENQSIKEKLKDSQLDALELKEKIKELETKLTIVQNELLSSRLERNTMEDSHRYSSNTQQQSIALLKSKYESLCSVLESKNKQIKTKDEFIQKALIAKINKRDSEDEVEYLMKELRSICP